MASGSALWVRAIVAAIVVVVFVLGWIGVSVLISDFFEPTTRAWILRGALAVALLGAAGVHITTLPTNAFVRVLAFPVSLALVLAGMAALFATQWTATARARSGLAAWVADESLRAMEQRHGYSVGGTALYPQVTRGTSVGAHGETGSEWFAWETERASGATWPGGARGVLVLVGADGSLQIDDAQGLLGRRGASDPADVAWVGLVSRQWPIGYSYSDGSFVEAERVDVRLVDVASDAVIARVSVGAVPPERRGARGPLREALDEDVLAAAVVAALDDERVVERPVPEWNAQACPAPTDLVEDLEAEPPLACVEGATPGCMALCDAGQPEACLAAAYTIEHDSHARARPLFALACRAGSAAGCTNFAAGLSGLERDDARVCARGLFERTCEAHEYYACGMLGAMLARGEGGPEDDARARTVLEADCADGRSFACAELGLAWHHGDLGEVDDGAALGWLDRACAIDGRACEQARSLRGR